MKLVIGFKPFLSNFEIINSICQMHEGHLVLNLAAPTFSLAQYSPTPTCANFLFNLGDISPFCWVIDTPVLDFWCCLPWVSMPGWIHLLACFINCAHWIPQIHLCATSADPLVASMEASHFIHVLVLVHWWGSSPEPTVTASLHVIIY